VATALGGADRALATLLGFEGRLTCEETSHDRRSEIVPTIAARRVAASQREERGPRVDHDEAGMLRVGARFAAAFRYVVPERGERWDAIA
jgi:hypothetical protein